MTNLWRILALAWLGGVGSPVLTEDAVSEEVSRSALTEVQDERSVSGMPGLGVASSDIDTALVQDGSSGKEN